MPILPQAQCYAIKIIEIKGFKAGFLLKNLLMHRENVYKYYTVLVKKVGIGFSVLKIIMPIHYVIAFLVCKVL